MPEKRKGSPSHSTSPAAETPLPAPTTSLQPRSRAASLVRATRSSNSPSLPRSSSLPRPSNSPAVLASLSDIENSAPGFLADDQDQRSQSTIHEDSRKKRRLDIPDSHKVYDKGKGKAKEEDVPLEIDDENSQGGMEPGSSRTVESYHDEAGLPLAGIVNTHNSSLAKILNPVNASAHAITIGSRSPTPAPLLASTSTLPATPVLPRRNTSPAPPAEDPLSSYACPICFSPPMNATLTPCGHICCGACLFTAVKTTMQRAQTMATEAAPRCPVCRAQIPGWDGKGGGVIGLQLRAVFSL